MSYALYYWPSIQGRGEFVRLALEDAGADYVDVARRKNGVELMLKKLKQHQVFAPPFLCHGKVVVAQTALILHYLGPHLGLAPRAEAARLRLLQLQLTITDFLVEVHDTHHPIANSLYYEDQKLEALRRAQNFRALRLPKFLGYFERVLAANPGGDRYLIGKSLTYVDLSMFQVIAGLNYAFPRAMEGMSRQHPRLTALHQRVRERPRIAAYLASSRRIPFNERGIFRRYPELD